MKYSSYKLKSKKNNFIPFFKKQNGKTTHGGFMSRTSAIDWCEKNGLDSHVYVKVEEYPEDSTIVTKNNSFKVKSTSGRIVERLNVYNY